MKYLGVILLAWLSISQAGQDIYVCKNASVTLFSSAPLEDIKAISGSGVSVFNISTGQLEFSVLISSFKFPKSLMEEHFNSEYMESDKFPMAGFKGKINAMVDAAKDGSYPISAIGDLTIHGVTQKRTINGKITIKGGVISMTSEFIVKCADHHIDIPTLVFHRIAESIQVNVSATYSAYAGNAGK